MKMDSSPENLENLITAYKNCKEEKKKRMLHLKIVEDAMYLVKKIANIISSQSGISLEDLIQVGSIGLIKAIESYNTEYSTKFSTYATHLIKGEIKHYLRDKVGFIKTPREIQELVTTITSAKNKLIEDGINEPSVEEIAKVSGICATKVEEVLNIDKYKNTVSLDQFLTEDEFSLLDQIPAEDYQEYLNAYEDKLMLVDILQKLPPDLREVIQLCYFEELNQREISEKLHLSKMQVSRRLKKALNRMYELINRSTIC